MVAFDCLYASCMLCAIGLVIASVASAAYYYGAS